MSSVQYTVRGVPAEVDEALRQEARSSDSSLNAVLVEALTRTALPGSVVHDDLDWFIGSAPPASDEEAAAAAWLDALPRDLA